MSGGIQGSSTANTCKKEHYEKCNLPSNDLYVGGLLSQTKSCKAEEDVQAHKAGKLSASIKESTFLKGHVAQDGQHLCW